MSSVEAHFHPSPLQTLAPHLIPLLPSTIPLLRRLQHPLQTPHARVLATFSPTATSPPSYPFAAAYLDWSRAPDCHCWIYSTLELGTTSTTTQDVSRAQIVALLQRISNLPFPSLSAHIDQSPSSPKLLKVGSLHSSILSLLLSFPTQNISPPPAPILPGSGQKIISRTEPSVSQHVQGAIAAHTIPYTKYIIAPPRPLPPSTTASTTGPTLPPSLHFSTVFPAEYPLVISRTAVPRTERTLSPLRSVAVREKSSLEQSPNSSASSQGKLTAWGFEGLDGSVTSLHVEEKWRGQGLGKAVAWRVLETMREGEDEGCGWGHADVAGDNVASRAVVESVGGTVGWECYWCWVDLERVRTEE
ncbi:hypothetical protein MMC20_005974 [Loxospora ochrophaea]|nr:hypothetical protein [Loxospora ochrophaea]